MRSHLRHCTNAIRGRTLSTSSRATTLATTYTPVSSRSEAGLTFEEIALETMTRSLGFDLKLRRVHGIGRKDDGVDLFGSWRALSALVQAEGFPHFETVVQCKRNTTGGVPVSVVRELESSVARYASERSRGGLSAPPTRGNTASLIVNTENEYRCLGVLVTSPLGMTNSAAEWLDASPFPLLHLAMDDEARGWSDVEGKWVRDALRRLRPNECFKRRTEVHFLPRHEPGRAPAVALVHRGERVLMRVTL